MRGRCALETSTGAQIRFRSQYLRESGSESRSRRDNRRQSTRRDIDLISGTVHPRSKRCLSTRQVRRPGDETAETPCEVTRARSLNEDKGTSDIVMILLGLGTAFAENRYLGMPYLRKEGGVGSRDYDAADRVGVHTRA